MAHYLIAPKRRFRIIHYKDQQQQLIHAKDCPNRNEKSNQTDKNIANFKEAAQHAQAVENCHICLCQWAQVVMGAAPNV